MIIGDYAYLKPTSLEALYAALAQPDSHVLAGGTDIVLALRDDKIKPSAVVDIKAVPELRGIRQQGDKLFIGAAEPVQAVVEHPLTQPYTALVQGAGHIGCYEIRRRATIGGNICNGSPSADSVPGLLVYDAEAVLVSAEGRRVLPLCDFLLGPGRVALAPGEVLLGVLLPGVAEGSQSRYYRLSRVKGMDLSGLAAAVYCEGLSGFRIAFGAAWPTVARARKAEAILNSAPFSTALLTQAANAILDEVKPRRSSMRASPEYKRTMIPQLIKMGIEEMNGGECLE